MPHTTLLSKENLNEELIKMLSEQKNVSVEEGTIFFDRGADVNIERNAGDTPLFSAVAGKHREIAKLLLEKGSNPNTKNLWGYTPLQ